MEVKNNPVPLAENCFAAGTLSFQVDLSGDVHADTPTYAAITFEWPTRKSYFAQVAIECT